MAASCCFHLQTTRGPHSAHVHRYCHLITSNSSPPAPVLSIGRKQQCWLRLPQDLEVSSVHAEFHFITSEKRVALRDVNSTNGTKLNGKPLEAHKDYLLSNGDVIGVGRTSLRFVQVEHGPSCSAKTPGDGAGTGAYVARSIQCTKDTSAVRSEVIVLDDDSSDHDQEEVENTTGSRNGPTDQPDSEPDRDNARLLVARKSERGKKEVESVAKVVFDVGGESSLEEATCTACRARIGQLDLLEQQAHLNECIGGRVLTSAASTIQDKRTKPRRRGKAGDVSGVKRKRKPKVGEENAKGRIPRKRKRAADPKANIAIALALTGTTTRNKVEQTEEQIAVAKEKLAQLDAQLAKLAKRRVNLLKNLDRLEKTKDKFRKSHVLPPAKVFQLFNLEAALASIFPIHRQAHSTNRQVKEKCIEATSDVAKRYTPSRWRKRNEGDEQEQDDEAAVDAISMWARASQQCFALQSDTLLYRNSVLRPFLGDVEHADGGGTSLDCVGDVIHVVDGNDKRGHASDAKFVTTAS